ncbi:iron-containing redox enzyme family protein [Microbacterium sp. SORGH_AS_0969]|uniref:iron-containing redox enzyme family protein n=1 Tax=Microbacterium TaxID=33882 RepID=UPI0027803E88|nr:hypothetical protein [Microbacterium sp. SORGH_AS_0969]MDQ1116306.1 hypothetical protein [Microbacterium testaceum]
MSVTIPSPLSPPDDRAVAPTLPFRPRGPVSAAVLDHLVHGAVTAHTALADAAVAASVDIERDEDLQLALFALYASSYGSIPAFRADLEWNPSLIATRRVIETAFDLSLRRSVEVPALPAATADAVARALFTMTGADTGPSLSRHLARKATLDQAREFLVQRTIYTLREADPHSWAIPRLTGRPKAALVEIQSDEYGGGRPDRVHATLFARAVRAAGLDAEYGAYIDEVPAVTLASHNAMSMFGLNRRLLGAIVGHLAAFEMTSSIPNRLYAEGLRRLGFDDDVCEYFDEHVEADAVHEQIAGHDLAGALAEDRPDLLADILFGAAVCLEVDARVGRHMLDAWSRGESSLREEDAR